MKILITGAAGFIGSHLARFLCKKKISIYGIDNISDYYDKKLKLDRLKWIKNKYFNIFFGKCMFKSITTSISSEFSSMAYIPLSEIVRENFFRRN